MVMNMSANMLGLGNAATPLGLRAMRDLETLNPRPGVATNAMCTFLAINTSSVQLIPATAIAILAASGSTRPTAIVGTALLATLCAASVAIISVKLLEKLSIFQPSRPTPVITDDSRHPSVPQSTTELPEETPVAELPPHRASIYGSIALGILTVLFLVLFVRMVAPNLFGFTMAPDTAAQNSFVGNVNAFSILAIPVLFSFFSLCSATLGVKVYEEFVGFGVERFFVVL